MITGDICPDSTGVLGLVATGGKIKEVPRWAVGLLEIMHDLFQLRLFEDLQAGAALKTEPYVIRVGLATKRRSLHTIVQSKLESTLGTEKGQEIYRHTTYLKKTGQVVDVAFYHDKLLQSEN